MGPSRISPGAASLLEARGEVDGLARHEGRVARLVDDQLSGLDPDSSLEAELVDGAPHGERSTRGALGIVLVRLRNPECGKYRVAGELLHDPAVERHAVRDLLEELGHAAPHDLRVGARDDARRVDEVHEQDRGELALHA